MRVGDRETFADEITRDVDACRVKTDTRGIGGARARWQLTGDGCAAGEAGGAHRLGDPCTGLWGPPAAPAATGAPGRGGAIAPPPPARPPPRRRAPGARAGRRPTPDGR